MLRAMLPELSAMMQKRRPRATEPRKVTWVRIQSVFSLSVGVGTTWLPGFIRGSVTRGGGGGPGLLGELGTPGSVTTGGGGSLLSSADVLPSPGLSWGLGATLGGALFDRGSSGGLLTT